VIASAMVGGARLVTEAAGRKGKGLASEKPPLADHKPTKQNTALAHGLLCLACLAGCVSGDKGCGDKETDAGWKFGGLLHS
jgi:hypothetical protein